MTSKPKPKNNSKEDPASKSGIFGRIKGTFKRGPSIKEIVREPTSGGIVYRPTNDNKDIEILLIEDAKGRWTIPKGHIEPGESAKQTTIREIGEETGLTKIKVQSWLGKVNFKYRRQDRLILMTMQVYLVRALDAAEKLRKEKWMTSIKWIPFTEAVDTVEYPDIAKLILLAKKKVRTGEV